MDIEPLLVTFKDYCDLLGIRPTKGHELLNNGEIQNVLRLWAPQGLHGFNSELCPRSCEHVLI